MKIALVALMAILACACIAQTHANPLEFVDSIKDKITGNDEPSKEENKEEEKKDEKEKYEGGFAKQIVHSVIDAGVDTAAREIKKNNGNIVVNPIIKMASKKIKSRMHEAVNDMGEEEPKVVEEKKEEEVKEDENKGEKKEESEGGIKGLINKITRRKRSLDVDPNGGLRRNKRAARNPPKDAAPGGCGLFGCHVNKMVEGVRGMLSRRNKKNYTSQPVKGKSVPPPAPAPAPAPATAPASAPKVEKATTTTTTTTAAPTTTTTTEAPAPAVAAVEEQTTTTTTTTETPKTTTTNEPKVEEEKEEVVAADLDNEADGEDEPEADGEEKNVVSTQAPSKKPDTKQPEGEVAEKEEENEGGEEDGAAPKAAGFWQGKEVEGEEDEKIGLNSIVDEDEAEADNEPATVKSPKQEAKSSTEKQ